MRPLDYLATAQTNLLRTKLRTFLTVLAFVIGTFTLAMTTAFSQGLRSYINTQLHAYGQANIIYVRVASKQNQSSSSGVPYYQDGRQASVNGREGKATYTLSQHDLEVVRSAPDVQAAYPDYSNMNINYIQTGQSQKYVLEVQSAVPGESTDLAAGSFPKSGQDGIVLPYAYVEALGANSASQLIGKTATLNVTDITGVSSQNFNVTVTGVLPDTAHAPPAYLSYQTLDRMVSFQSGSNAAFTDIIAVTAPGVTKAQRQQIKSDLSAKNYDVQTYDDILQGFSRPLSVVTFGLTGFSAIALLAATIGIVNTLLMAVLERTQEIGLLKALGMRRRGITTIYLVEAASIGFWGGVVGVVAGYLLGLLLNPVLSKTVFKGIGAAHILHYPLPYMAGIVVGAMIIGLLAGTLPAIRAGRLNPIDALRHE